MHGGRGVDSFGSTGVRHDDLTEALRAAEPTALERLDADRAPLLEPDVMLLAQLKLRMATQEIADGPVGTLAFATLGLSRA